ncbi:MAG: DNA helicase/exodeoxyribonuclease V, subunit A [Candidatus Kentron sp. G]|nr:MAG: DNA helicase/exodeoxyribonuclease V, subunit A [Candidatus Kentron sp. G]VFM98827.1 MAG: DNA helicase/exodeoxyribonuclease V, subunit A [Candidatus Kentron sp. G]VFN00424.1 MAG: DNA helicase/exodeoxyribonuclease V, subunit A [Candidatus Kentron sp. G]
MHPSVPRETGPYHFPRQNDAVPTDRTTRQRALDPTHSFIVQAPAGSGKTGLLIQRYLTLLALVDHPEEVVAVTFTRKAAGEMHERVLMALERAREGQGETSSPISPFDHHTRELAREAVARDTARGWDIRSYPARLRIQTIDSLCASIIRMAPWRSGLGGEVRTVEDAEPLYREAVRELMEVLEAPGPWADALERVLVFLDNDLTRFEATLVRMLARRDQWLRHFPHGEDDLPARRRRMTHALETIMEDALGLLRASVPVGLSETIVAVAAYAGGNLAAIDPASPIAVLAGLDALPGDGVRDIPLWLGIAALLLTETGTWRARYTKNQGFPPAPKAKKAATGPDMKKTVAELMADLSDAEPFRARLQGVRELPAATYDDRHWRVLDALLTVLRLAAATLRLVFSKHGTVDFIEVAHGALAALGEEGAPTDLALGLDYRIRHLLVDEFQDTSHGQVHLFTALTAGWQPGDGRTLFLVGDPMQSIYRFREADVALYLHARRFGIGNIPLEPLTLSANFRSEPPIVEWSNRTFPLVFPSADEEGAGAVGFSPSTPTVPARLLSTGATGGEYSGVWIHPYLQDQGEQEADQVLALIRQTKGEDPDGSIAILVRTRNHLDTILPRLDAAGIPYRGVELAPLARQPAVQDLLALTRALLHPGDRIAWLAVLRAPWCGLTLHDLHALASVDHDAPILERLRAVLAVPPPEPGGNPAPGQGRERGSPIHGSHRLSSHSEVTGCKEVPFHETAVPGTLTPDGRTRLERVLPILDEAVRQRSRGPLRTTVEAVWMALGGAACIPAGNSDVTTFFALLEGLEAEAGVLDGQRIAERVSRLYATPDMAQWSVEIMTIHKAKGLEFDTVIVPGLGRAGRSEEKPLLAWVERPAATGGSDLILAAMPGPGEPDDPTYRYLRRIEETKAHHEVARLLYVAATRARRRLHLLGQARISERTGEVLPPGRRSLLYHLWPALSSCFTDLAPCPDAEDDAQDRAPHPWVSDSGTAFCRESMADNEAAAHGALWRLPPDWTRPQPPAPLAWSADYLPGEILAGTEPVEYLWAGHMARSVGTIIHRILRYLAEPGRHPAQEGTAWADSMQGWDKQGIWRAALRGLGVREEELEPAMARIAQVIGRVMEDPRWHWLLDPSHTHVRNEYPLTGIVTGRQADRKLISGVIDRTFVDKEGTRWIIDYKTGVHEGGDPAGFLDREQTRYRPQLERYGNLLANKETRPIRAGLYFPALGGWRTWEVIPAR